MMLKRQPFPNEKERAQLVRDDEEYEHTTLMPPPPQIVAPSYGAPQRDAVSSIVDGVVHEVIESIRALQGQLKAMEDQVLVSAAAAKNTLSEQMDVCARVRDETERVADIIDEIAKKVLRL